ncbi:MAG: serine/threonine-protein kinase [Chloroflexota bacterium]
MNNLVGSRIGKYELIRMLGRGGMAEVYEAFQPGTERSVAIKVLRGYSNETPESVARFKREARSIAQLRHTNIVQVFDFDIDESLYYMVMEYIRGGTLGQMIHDGGALSVTDTLRLMIQLADALAYAHEHGVIHRDIKPVNIMFTDAAHKHPVVTDFGIARIMGDPVLTADGRFMGSPAYISPEVVRGLGADARSDIYGLGLVFYEMLTGQRPYHADSTGELVVQHLNAPLPSPRQFNPAVPQSVEIVLSKALAKDRERRYQTAAEFRLILERTLASLGGYSAANSPVQPGSHSPTGSATVPLNEIVTDTLPFDEPVDSRTKTLPPEESVPVTTQVDEKPRRRSPILVLILIIALAGMGIYLVATEKQAVAGDNATATQPAAIQVTITTASAVGDVAVSITPTTPSPTSSPTPTNTLMPTSTLDVGREKEGGIVKPTAAPTDTATVTVQATNTSRPRATQPPAQSNPTSAPAQPTNDPGSGNGGGGGSTGGGATGGSNPVQNTVDQVSDTVQDAAQPVIDVIQQVLPTVCLLGCH